MVCWQFLKIKQSKIQGPYKKTMDVFPALGLLQRSVIYVANSQRQAWELAPYDFDDVVHNLCQDYCR
jgi:hypothetical protein